MNTKILLDRSDIITILYKQQQTIIQWKKERVGKDAFEFIAVAKFLIKLK